MRSTSEELRPRERSKLGIEMDWGQEAGEVTRALATILAGQLSGGKVMDGLIGIQQLAPFAVVLTFGALLLLAFLGMWVLSILGRIFGG